MENKRVKKRIRSIAAAAAALSLALSFAYAEELGVDRAGFGTAVTVSADDILEEVYCGPGGAHSAKATLYSDEKGYGTLVISGNGQIDAENSLLKDYITNNSQYQDMIQKIVIEDGITDIPQNCFFECRAYRLQSVEIGKDVRSIGGAAFYMPMSIGVKEVVFADNSSLETIGNDAFLGIGKNYFKKIKIPDSVTTIGNHAFYDCSALESVEFDVRKSKLESIGKEAFAECPELKNLVIPNSVKTLGSNWLSSVSGYIAYPKDLAGSIPASAVTNAVSFEYTVDGNDVVLTGVENPGETVTVPDFITVIGENAFSNNDCKTKITSVTLPDTITRIRANAFNGCEKLQSINIPDAVTSVGDGAFNGCKELQSIKIPDAVTSVGNSAFKDCSALESVEFDMLKSKLVSIGDYAFQNCSSLKDLVIPNSVKTLSTDWLSSVNGYIAYPRDLAFPYDAVRNAVSFKYEVEGNDVVLTGVFNPGKTVTVPDFITVIGEYAFDSAVCRNVTNITLPDTITEIRNHAFYDCSSLESINIPKNVTDIGSYAFENCSVLSNVNFEDGSKLSSISESVFKGCKALKSIDIPQNVTNIGDTAFADCTALSKVKFEDGSKLSSIGSFAFNNCTALNSIDIPENVIKLEASAFNSSGLKSITIPKSVTEIGTAAFLGCTSLSNVNFDDGSNLSSIGKLVFGNCTALERIDIPENVTNIETSAFAYSGLKSVTIPKSVTEIGTEAFSNCTTLSNVDFENGSKLSSIGEMVFFNCTALERIEIPENVTKIETSAFAYSGLKSITIPKNVTGIGKSSFSGCTSLLNVDFGDGSVLEYISEEAFRGCVKLTAIEIPDSVDSIRYNAFDSCTSLETVKLPESASLGSGAFSGCSSIKSIVIPSGVPRIEDQLFKNCTSLRSIELHPGITYVGEYSFDGCTDLESIFIPSNVVPATNAVINTASKVLYEIKDSKAYITGITLGDGRSDVAIPETICGFPVVFVDENSRRYVGAHTHVAEKEICTEGMICGICGNSYTAASGHDDSDSWKYDADNHWKICAREGCGEQIKLEAHTFDNGVVTTEPTEYSEGVKTYTCIVCGYEKTEPIEKSDHTHKPSEKYTYDETEHWKTCTECNEKLDPEKHSFDEGVITTQPTADSEGVKTYTCTVCGYEKTESIEKLPEEPVKNITYPIVISGDVTVNRSDASAGETVDVSAPFGYDIIVTDGSGRQIEKMTDKGSFIMPASGVRITAVRGEIFAHMTNAWSHSYVYSYDSDMNRIKVNSDVKRGVVTIDLGVNYAGRSFTVYSGRKSTSKKITEGVLDENGRYTFSSDEGRNYTLVLD